MENRTPDLNSLQFHCLLRQLHGVKDLITIFRTIYHTLDENAQHSLIASLTNVTTAAGLLFPHPSPSHPHYRRLLKAFITEVEHDGQTIADELMDAFTATLHTSIDTSGWCYKLYSYAPTNEPPNLILEKLIDFETEAANTGWKQVTGTDSCGLLALKTSINMLEGGTGCHEWEAGFFLFEFVLNNPHLFKSRCCLELGSGTGMVGVALYRVGAARVICTDGDLEAVENCKANLALNGVPIDGFIDSKDAACVQRLLWEDGYNTADTTWPEVLLGADLLYDPSAIPPLLALTHQILQKASSTQEDACLYICTTRRNEATLQTFLDAVANHKHLQLVDITYEANHSGDGPEVRLCCVPVLDDSRDRILLHKLSLLPA